MVVVVAVAERMVMVGVVVDNGRGSGSGCSHCRRRGGRTVASSKRDCGRGTGWRMVTRVKGEHHIGGQSVQQKGVLWLVVVVVVAVMAIDE